jgi:phosphatidylglycerophosphatase A
MGAERDTMTRATRRLARVLATWFGCGTSPRAPGTVGTMGAVPLYLLVAQAGRVAIAATALVVTGLGIWGSSVVIDERRESDPQVVVIDEVAGLLVTMIAVVRFSWRSLIVGFIAFRLFDIVKPWPVRQLERLPGAWGVVFDDLGAGTLAALTLIVLQTARVLT